VVCKGLSQQDSGFNASYVPLTSVYYVSGVCVYIRSGAINTM